MCFYPILCRSMISTNFKTFLFWIAGGIVGGVWFFVLMGKWPMQAVSTNTVGEQWFTTQSVQADFGNLSCHFDENDVATSMPSIIVGGKASDYLASFDLNAYGADMLVKDIEISVKVGSQDFALAFKEAILFDEEGNELQRELIHKSEVRFNEVKANGGVDFIISKDATAKLYVSLVASLIWKNENWMEAGTYNLRMWVAHETLNPNNDIPAGALPEITYCDGQSKDFMTRAVAISSVDLVTSAGPVSLPSYLSHGISNKLGIVKVVADSWDNNDPNDASSINIVLDTLRVEFENGTEDPVAGVTLKKGNKKVTTTPQTVAAGTTVVEFDMTELSADADNVIQKWQTVYFVIEGTPVVDDKSESIRINLSDLYGGANASFEYYADFAGALTTNAIYLESDYIEWVLLEDNFDARVDSFSKTTNDER